MDPTTPPSQTTRNTGLSEDARINRLLAHIGSSLASGAILVEPTWLELSTPAWVEHLPFASWLVAAHRPRCLVELGTHFGNSYFAFCQAVAEQGLATRCYAVDTWRGDSHAGLYDDTVFATVNAHNGKHYAGFSVLVRSTFDEALTHFSDGSIDALHIDGLHTYEAVQHDFESWLPKLSNRAVVLFHDTNVRERDFGVYRFWSELARTYPHFEFLHGHGLGVLGVGSTLDEPLSDLFAVASDDRLAGVVRHLFWRSAANLRVQLSLDTVLRESKRHLQEAAAERERRNVLEHERELQKAEIERSRGLISDLQAEVLTRRSVKDLEREIQLRDARIRAVEEELRTVLTSETWRMTAPLRTLFTILQRKRRQQFATNSSSAGSAVVPPTAPATDLDNAKERLRQMVAARFDAFIAGDDLLHFTESEHPPISIVLLLWNQAPLTLACLEGLAQISGIPFEIVIVDNASTDRTGEMLKRLRGVHVIRNEENVGFLKGVNQGVAAARGELVLLLNNDAVLRPGSLNAASQILTRDRSVGAVGGRVILPNGRLQEAGSIVWRDGSSLGYARGEDPECGEAMFRRDVDYCSGVFLMFRRATFEELGGFDEAFAPAYYEETDFCLRLWEKGLRVVYEPRVALDHFEFGSAETSARAISLQARNRSIFLAKHADTLSRHLAAAPDAVLRARMRESGGGRALFIDDRVPLPQLGSGNPRAKRLLQEVAETGRFVTFYPLRFPAESWDITYDVVPPTVEVAMHRGLEGLRAFFEQRRGYYDTLIVSRPHNMAEIVDLRNARPELFAGMRIVYDAEAVFAIRDIHKARLLNDPVSLARAESNVGDEVALARAADAVLAVSDAEADQFRAACSAPVFVVGNTLSPTLAGNGFDTRRDLLFVGALDDEESPNVDSIGWFVREIMPGVMDRLGSDVRLHAVGRNRAASLRALDPRRVNLIGLVDNVARYYEHARVFVAPTRFAAGIPLKIHEAIAHGLPVVATSLLAAQLGWQHEKELLVADDPATFVTQVVRVYTDPVLWHSLRGTALARLTRDCDPEVFRTRVRQALDAN